MQRTPQAPSPASLSAAGRAELRGLAAALKAAKPGESVHGARRRIKRVRSLLRLLRETLGEERFAAANTSLRTAADALAGQRRAEALVAAAGRLGGGHKGRAAWQSLAEAHAAESEAGGGLAPARASIAEALRVLAAPRLPRRPSPAVAAAFLMTYRKARKRLRQGFETGDAEALHTARKHVIHHLHHIDLLRDHLRRTDGRLAALERLRGALGDLNDLDELSQLAAATGGPLPEPAARSMAKHRAQLLARAEASAERLFRLKPEAFRKRIGAMWETKQR
jgi:CHAD domain-containing protein